MEIWKDIKGYEGLYQVSTYGRVKNKKLIMAQKTNKDGYLTIRLSKNGTKKDYIVHRLVAQAFIENKDNLPQINHKDENKLNNNVDNLEWCTCSYNINYGNRNKKMAEKISQKVAKYDTKGNLIKIYDSMTKAQNENKIWHSRIGLCCRGKSKTAGGFKWQYAN